MALDNDNIFSFVDRGWEPMLRAYDAIRRHRDGEGQRGGGGVEDMGGNQDQYTNYGKAWPSGEGKLRENKDEIRRASTGGRQLRVAVIGDFMEDRYWIGEATRISAEVPIPVVKITDNFFQPGGAGNVAMNLQKLFGYGMDTLNYGGMPPTKNRLMVGDHQLARWDERDYCQPYLGLFEYEKWDAIVVADYGKGAITPEIVERIKKFNGPIFVDTKGDPSIWSGVATAIFPNNNEWMIFNNQYNTFNGIVILKQGADGLRLLPDIYKGIGCKQYHSPAQARFVRSVNGAGDTVIAAFVYKYLDLQSHYGWHEQVEDIKQEQWQNCLDFASAAAAIAVENPYTYAPTFEEVEERYNPWT